MSNALSTLNKVRGAVNAISNDLNDIRATYGLGYVLAKPIGIVRKNHPFIHATLKRNIGNDFYDLDGIGTAISDNSNPYLNSYFIPWFDMDYDKKKYKDYIDYSNSLFFNGTMSPIRFPILSGDLKLVDNIPNLIETDLVGVFRGYDFRDDSFTNPNSEINDTRLGVVNNFYRKKTLENADQYYWRYDNNTEEKGGKISKVKSLTYGIYDKFDIDGELGIKNGHYSMPNDKVMNMEIISGSDIKLHSSKHFNNDWEKTLYNLSNNRTREYILKALLGVDLCDYDKILTSASLNVDNYTEFNQKYTPKYTYFKHFRSVDVNISNDTYNIPNSPHRLLKSEGYLSVYEESNVTFSTSSQNDGINFGNIYGFDNLGSNKNGLVGFTNEKFKKGLYDTIIGRFYTGKYDNEYGLLSSAQSKVYGMSKGRNLLKKNHTEKDPYCRVWTYNKQYSKLNSLIRPFDKDNRETLKNTLKESYQVNRDRLDKYSSKHDNGLVLIAPTKKDEIKKCMFSIENLAWKGERSLFNGYDEQVGPCKGRIMWFPPYGLSFNETVNVDWNSSNFIGRGEPIYTYTNTNRSGTLNFKLLIDHPSLINNFTAKTDKGDIDQGVNNPNSTEQTLLRFFAGCEVIEANKIKPNVIAPNIHIPPKLEPLPEPIILNKTITKEIAFYVFFPNYYSGIDDKNGVVKSMEYIINGLGCNLTKDESGNIKDIPTSNVEFNDDKGGYEIGTYGISCVDTYSVSSQDSFTSAISSNETYDLYPNKQLNRVGNYNYWGYRIDKEYSNRILSSNSNYGDVESFCLNSKGFTNLLNVHKDANKYYDEGLLFSFATVFSVLEPNYKDLLMSKDALDETSYNVFKKLIEEYDVVNIETKGFASSHGNKKENEKLALNRANTVINWLCSKNSKFSKDKHKHLGIEIGGELESSVSYLTPKAWRCAKVVISLSKEEISEAYKQNSLNEGQINYFNRLLEKYSNDENAQFLKESLFGINEDTYKNLTSYEVNALMSLINKAKNDKQFEFDEIESNNQQNVSINNSYGSEYTFFKELSEGDSLLHHRLKDKIKYFDPAFHSISPEGFNARLNFLHQCTRQGSTSSSSDLSNENRTANNLSFGRPPVCVLRLGDFYNTKIIITNMTIDFSDTTWDLNDEGIGVMPMMADISLSFNFLGGSDLGGPISRLQNAVSFNYYSNTVVYDDRADRLIDEK